MSEPPDPPEYRGLRRVPGVHLPRRRYSATVRWCSGSTRRRSRPRSRPGGSTPVRWSPVGRRRTPPRRPRCPSRTRGRGGMRWSPRARRCPRRFGPTVVAIVGRRANNTAWCCSTPTGEPVRPAKLWNDTTSAPQGDALVSSLGASAWADAVGTVPVPAITITKLAWVAEHEPDALARTARVMLPHDYLTWRLTGEHVTDRGDASGTGWYDPVSDAVRQDLLGAAVGGVAGWARRAAPSARADRGRRSADRRCRGRSSVCRPASWSGPERATTWPPPWAWGWRRVTWRSRSARRARRSRCRRHRPVIRRARWRGSRRRAASTYRWCARSMPPRSPTPSPAGSGSTPPGWRRWR